MIHRDDDDNEPAPLSSPHHQTQQHHEHAHVTEQTPLLDGGRIAPDGHTETAVLLRPEDEPVSADGADRPLPMLQVFLLCYARIVEPVSFFAIFPYIGEMIQRNGNLEEQDVGFYAGLIESLFSATQMLVLIHWGRLADRIGRKPVLMSSLIGTSLGPIAFGMSTRIWHMVLFRMLAGAFSGSSSLIIRTMLAEISTKNTQARAFSWFGVAGNIGIFLGPLLGGFFANPATQYPSVFGSVQFLHDYPYVLPGLITGGISATAAVACGLCLRETLSEDENVDEAAQKDSLWDIATAPGVSLVLSVYSLAMLLAFAFTAVMPVALYTSVKHGGIAFDQFGIAIYTMLQGASQTSWLMLAFPPMQTRLGTKRVLLLCGYAYPFLFVSFIVANTLLRAGTHDAKVAFWVFGAFATAVAPGVSMAFSGVQLLLNDVSPHSHVTATLNAIALTCSAGVRAIVPGVATAMYAVGVGRQILGGHLAWVLLIIVSVCWTACVKSLPDDRPQKKQVSRTEERAA